MAQDTPYHPPDFNDQDYSQVWDPSVRGWTSYQNQRTTPSGSGGDSSDSFAEVGPRGRVLAEFPAHSPPQGYQLVWNETEQKLEPLSVEHQFYEDKRTMIDNGVVYAIVRSPRY